MVWHRIFGSWQVCACHAVAYRIYRSAVALEEGKNILYDISYTLQASADENKMITLNYVRVISIYPFPQHFMLFNPIRMFSD